MEGTRCLASTCGSSPGKVWEDFLWVTLCRLRFSYPQTGEITVSSFDV